MADSAGFIIGYDDGDIDTNRSAGESLNEMVDRRYSRRDIFRSGTSAAAFAVFGGSLLSGCNAVSSIVARPVAIDPPATVTTGSSGATTSGRVVSLTGVAVDNAPIVSQQFVQVFGPSVTLTNPTAGSATFIAPSVSATTNMVFRYTVTDSAGSVTASDITVAVSPAQLGFTAIPKNRLDVVTLPPGYTATILYSLGDPINNTVPASLNNGNDTDYANRAGDHHDAIYWYGLAATGAARDDNSNTRGLLVINHENINQSYLHVNGPTSVGGVRPESEAQKEIDCHGLSVIETVRSAAGAWSYVVGSALNRRITPATPMTFNGPARGSPLLRTQFSPAGTDGRGTINNCANGFTLWGTNLTCEENWAGYFRRPTAVDNPRRTPKEITGLARFGVGSTNGNYGWASVAAASPANTLFRRWDVQATGASATDDFRHEPNQYGWVVEIDPYNPTSTPRKRTALGRFNHEGAWPSLFVVGRRPAFYMGDDAQNEYLYKFVSAAPWVAGDATAADRLAVGDRYLDAGTLFVARFSADGTGQWLPLTFGSGPLTPANTVYSFADQVDVLVHTRLAADAVGATRMDRPEWTAVNPVNGEMYLTLTNNASRTAATTDAANPRVYVDAPSPAVGNRNGHILRLREAGNTSEATSFTWDIYVFAAGSDLDAANINLSGLDATNDFSSPDGLWFGRPSNATGLVSPLLWVQTDDGAFTDVTNNQMLVAFPGSVGDGGNVTITNAGGTTQTTRRGALPGTQLRRFLVGPVQCEITGIDSTPDGRSVFVNIQHPGENGGPANITSNWPASQAGPATGSRPRSATIVITKNDGGVVGL